jgi:NAD-dependent dihydropyrimidine dehydrogenase PreA subunit
VDNEKCSGCEECLEVCTAEVFEIRAGKAAVVRPDDCVGCESCIEICKEEAVTIDGTRVEMSDTCLSLLKDIL